MEAEWEAGDDDEEMEEAEGDGGAEAVDAEAEDGPEDGGVEPAPKRARARPAAAAAAGPGAPAAGLLPGESYGCSKCRHAQRGCARCQLFAEAGLNGYFMQGDDVIRRSA